MAGQVFRYSVQTARCERDITQDLIDALQTPVTQHLPTIFDPEELRILLNAIDDYQGSFEVRTALKLVPILFVRSGKLALHARSTYLFPAIHTTMQSMSENITNQALKRLGYDGSKQTIHGFRAAARTLVVEMLQVPDYLVEMQLGHNVRNMHGRAYNSTVYVAERKIMMQKWADHLADLKLKNRLLCYINNVLYFWIKLRH